MSDYTEQRARDLQLRIRTMLRELPDVCFDYIDGWQDMMEACQDEIAAAVEELKNR